MERARRHYPELTAYLEHLEKTHVRDTVPAAKEIKDFDHIQDVIAGLNAADPTLKLAYCDILDGQPPESFRNSPLAARLALEVGKGGSWREFINDGDHRFALGIRCSASSNDVSMPARRQYVSVLRHHT